MNKKNQVLMSVLGVFALVIVTVGASYAFFTYSRTGTTTNSITSGDISFTYSEVKDVTISDAFPVADAIGAADTANLYEFSVSGSASSNSVELKYNVTLLSNNTKTLCTDENTPDGCVKGYFTSDNIKVNLVKNDTDYVFGTANSGVKLSTVTGFTAGTTTGSGVIAANQTVSADGTDSYKLRMWISDDVDYSNTVYTQNGTGASVVLHNGNYYLATDTEFTTALDASTVTGQDEQTSIGKYSGYEYSLKVKVDATAVNNYEATVE